MLHQVQTDYSQPYAATQSAGVDLFADQATRSIDVNELAVQLNYPTEEVLILAEQGQLCGRKLQSNGKWRFVPNAAIMYTRSLVQEYTHRDCSHTALETLKPPTQERSYTSLTSRANEVEVINKDSAASKLETCNAELPDVESINRENGDNQSNNLHDKSNFGNWNKEQDLIAKTKLSVENFFRDNSTSQRSEISKKALEKLKNDEAHLIPNFVHHCDIKLVFCKKKNKYRTDFAKKSHPFNGILNKILSNSINAASPTRKFLAFDENESADMLNALIYEKAQQKELLASILPPEGRTLNDAIKLYIQGLNSGNRKDVQDSLSPLGCWSHFIGDIPLDEVTYPLLTAVVDKFVDAGLKGSTRTNYVSSINQCLETALKAGWTRVPVKLKTCQSNRREYVDVPIEKWKGFCSLYGVEEQEKRFWLSLHTSIQRHANWRNLKDSQIDFDKNVIQIPSSEHKSGKFIDVVMSSDTAQVLKQCIEYKKKTGNTSQFVFASDSRGTLPVYDSDRWQECLNKSDIEDLVPHHLRIYGCTEMRRNGATLAEIMQVSGHTSEEGLSRYIHTTATDGGHKAANNRNRL